MAGAGAGRATTSSRASVADPEAGQPPRLRLRIVAVTPTGTRESADGDDLPGLVADPEVRLWVDLTDPTPALVEGVASAPGLHPLVAEDIVERNQRAKIEFYEDVAHLVLFGLTYARLTGVTVILAGIGAVAGIFGMSEAGNALAGGEASGFWLVTAFVVGIALTEALILHRLDWI